MKNGVKYSLLTIIMAFLFMPLMQENFNLSKVRPLQGDYLPEKDIRFTQEGWFSKKFQEQKEKHIKDHFGYHNTYVRLRNQIYFSLFNKAMANGIVIGKKNYLYEHAYIDAYYGSDFIGVDSMRKKMLMVDYVADTLRKINKSLILVFTPGKGAYYSEFIPDHMKQQQGITNLEVVTALSKELDVPYINFHSWFIEQKNKSTYPLMARYGIHWSQYGSMVAWDSVHRYIEKIHGIDIPNLRWEKLNQRMAFGTDMDIENGMNLLFGLKPEIMAYPEMLMNDTIGNTKPSVLVIGDSFYWQVYGAGVSQLYKRSDFWYYFKSAHSPRYDHGKPIEEVDIMDEIKQHDVIIVMSTDIHLSR